MIVLGIDPGATRCGWAVVSGELPEEPKLQASGIFGLERGRNERYQDYRLRLIEFWVTSSEKLLAFQPDLICSEIVPAVGGGNFVLAAQSQLAGTVQTVILGLACSKGFEIRQVSANTVKRRIGGKKDATKAKVKDGVIRIIPDFKSRWATVKGKWDETDAIAVALTELGYEG